MEPNRPTVLIVEDEPGIVLMERNCLEEGGFAIEVAETGKSALETLEKQQIDLVLLDHRLPDTSSQEFVHSLGDRIGSLPVVIVTAYGDESLAVELLKAGVADYLVKDVDLQFIQTLPRIVDACLELFRLKTELKEHQNHLEKMVAIRTTKLTETTEQLRQEIADRARVEKAMRTIVEETAFRASNQFLDSLVKHLAEALDVRFAFVSEVVDSKAKRLRLLAYWTGSEFGDTFEYDVQDTPCEEVIRQGLTFYTEDVQALFPKDDWLKENEIVSYQAVPLFEFTGLPLGHLGIAHNKPMKENDLAESILRTFAARASAEIERKRNDDSLQASHRQLKKTLAELKQTQQQVIQQERLRAVGQLAGGVAHDLNNSLSPVLGYAEMLASAPDLPETLRQWARLIEMGARDAAAVVERLREFYRPEGESQGDRQTVNLQELMTQIPQLTRPKWRDEAQRTGRNIEFELDLDSFPLVHGNPSELREVLTNLVFNSVDAMPSGGEILLRLKSTPEYAVIEVTDTGIGMIEDVATRCFEPFFMAKGTEGTGLGLSVCHGIVQRHGGLFEIDTEPGHGTTMRILLPLTFEEELAELEEPMTVDLPSRKVLYIDDDRRLRQLASTLLQELGQDVDLAGSGAAGLERFQKIEYDVVLTDLGMPGIDGREVTRIIKETRQHVPVIMVTGWGSKALHEQIGFAVEPDQLLSKPLTLAKLREALEKAFAQPEIAANSD